MCCDVFRYCTSLLSDGESCTCYGVCGKNVIIASLFQVKCICLKIKVKSSMFFEIQVEICGCRVIEQDYEEMTLRLSG